MSASSKTIGWGIPFPPHVQQPLIQTDPWSCWRRGPSDPLASRIVLNIDTLDVLRTNLVG